MSGTESRSSQLQQLPDLASEATLSVLEEARWEAVLASDAQALRELLHDDLSYVHSNGVVDDKRSLIDAIATGRYRYLKVEPDVARIMSIAGTGVVVGTVIVSTDAEGATIITRARYTATWIRTAQGWRFLAWHACPTR